MLSRLSIRINRCFLSICVSFFAFAVITVDLPAASPKKIIAQAESYSQAAAQALAENDYKKAYRLCSEILAFVQENKDVHGCRYLPYFIDEEIFEPVIRYLSQTDANEAVRLCDGNIGLMELKLYIWWQDGYIKTWRQYVIDLSFQHTKAAYLFQDEGLNDAAELYFSKALEVYEQHGIKSQEYCDALWDMANFQQTEKHDYAKSIACHAKRINAIAEVSGAGSDAMKEAYANMYDVYALATSWVRFAGYPGQIDWLDVEILDFEAGKRVGAAMREANKDLMEKCGKDVLVACYGHQVSLKGQEYALTAGKSIIDLIRHGLYPYESYESILSEIYRDEAALDLVYGQFEDFRSDIVDMSSYCGSYEEFTAEIDVLSAICLNLNMIDLSIYLMSECLSVVAADRPDLAEYVGATLIPLTSSHSHPRFYEVEPFFTESVFRGSEAKYYDVNNCILIYSSCLRRHTMDFDEEKASRLAEVLSSVLESRPDANINMVSAALASLKDFHYWFDDKEKGDQYARKCVDILLAQIAESLAGNDPANPSWPIILYSELAKNYGSLREFEKAKSVLKQCLVYYSHNDNTSTNINHVYSELAWIADKEDNKEDFRSYAPLLAESAKGVYLDRTFGMTKRERVGYYYDSGLPYFLGWFASVALSDENLAGVCYDIALYHKGFLLNREKAIVRNIIEGGDADLQKAYKEYSMSVSDGRDDAYAKEQNMMDMYAEHLEFRNTAEEINWHDVQESLGEGEIAIEFVLAEGLASQTADYAAVLIRKGWDAPKIVKIADEKEMMSLALSGSEAYSPDSRAYSVVWEPVVPLLKGVKRIYFSPDGFLSQLNIEVMADDDGRPMNEKFDVIRLSSTGHLCQKEERRKADGYDSALLFGGLKYDTDTTVMARHRNLYADSGLSEYLRGALPDFLRSGWKYLPGTKTEIHDIAGILNSGNVVTTLLEADEGTETAFKSFSFSEIPIIHIATHGFYMEEKEAKKEPVFSELYTISDHADPMKRAGLIFSGGQHAWLGEPLPDNVDDGILTADEIAGMNLFGTDLLVLSACQTALGDISRDGVFGLQRGFKLAGVNTIVMSLWQVSDGATSLMMTEFYKNLLAGKSKREAFRLAQDTVRDRYEDPFYWAAFIMLD